MALGITAAMVFQAAAPMVLGAVMGGGSDAPQKGADQQVQANNAAIAEQRAAAAQQRADLAPWASSGGAANTELMRRLGIGGNGRTGSYTPKTMEQLRGEMRGQFTTQGAGGGGGGGIEFLTREQDPENQFGGMRFAAPQTPQSYQTQFDEAGFNTAVNNAFDAQGAAREGEVDPLYGSLMRKFDQSDLDSDLVYQNGLKFGLDTGINQLNDRAASGGNYGSGAALKALTRFGNDYGTTKTAGAYDRNMGEKNQMFGFLSSPSQQGQSAAAGQGAAGLGSANQIGGYQTGIGNAQSAGTIGRANAVNEQIGGATDAFKWNQLLNRGGSNSYDMARNGMGFDRYLSGNSGSGD